jgi:hypothetical protein
MSKWIKPCEKSPTIGQNVWLALRDKDQVVPGVYTGRHGTGYYSDGEPVNPMFWMERTPPPRHPGIPATKDEAISEAIEALQSMNPLSFSVNLLPRLRAALEAE